MNVPSLIGSLSNACEGSAKLTTVLTTVTNSQLNKRTAILRQKWR